MKKLNLAAALCASTMLVPSAALAQSGDQFAEPPCERLVNYLQENPDYDFPVTMSEARQLRDEKDAAACTDRMRDINASLGYDGSGAHRANNNTDADNVNRAGADQANNQELGNGQGEEQNQWSLAESTRQEGEAQQSADLQGKDGSEDVSARNGERSTDGRIVVRRQPQQIIVDRAAPQVTVRQQQPTVNVQQAQPQITIHQPAPTVTIDIPQPEITILMPRPDVQVSEARPEVSVRQPEPQVRFSQQGEPEVNIDQADANVQYERSGEPNVQISRNQEASINYEREEAKVRINQPQGQPQVRFEQPEGQAQASHRDQASRELRNELQQGNQTASADRSIDDQEGSNLADRDDMMRSRPGVDGRFSDNKATTQRDPTSDSRFDRTADADQDDRTPQSRDRTASDQTQGDWATSFVDDASTSNDPGLSENDSAAKMENQNGETITADELVGASVYSRDNESIGDVDEVLFAGNGDVEAIVLDVGGFLGLGAKPVAVAFSELDIRSTENEVIVRTNLTEQEFNSAKEYDADLFDRNRDGLLLTSR